jgi:hypothetical protein
MRKLLLFIFLIAFTFVKAQDSTSQLPIRKARVDISVVKAILLYTYQDYKKYCYNDSTIVQYFLVKESLAKGDTIWYPTKNILFDSDDDMSKYEFKKFSFHNHKPTFEGFMEWLEKYYGE